MQRTQREDPHPRPARSGRAAGPIQGTRILYVDDEPLLLRAIDRMLRAAGATSLLAGTHDQAVQFVASDPALALAIVDFRMPDGPVDALLRRLRAANAALPVIGTSGEDRRREFCDCGVTRFLAKPWRVGDLEQVAASMLPPNPQLPVSLPLDSRVGARPLSDQLEAASSGDPPIKAARTTKTHAKPLAPSRSETSRESIPTQPVPATPATWESFSEGFDRSFARVYAYVSRRASDPRLCERIVEEVLEGALELLVSPRDDQHEFRLLKAASDRRLAAHGFERLKVAGRIEAKRRPPRE